MFKNLLLVPILSVFVLAFYYSDLVFAATSDSVTATVTVQNIALEITTGGTVTYGTLAANSSEDTNNLGQTSIITNTGNVAIDINISGTNSAAWTLGATAGSEVYAHKFCTSSCDSYPTGYTAMTTGNTPLASSVASSGTVNLDLGIDTPTSTATFTQQSVNVTVQASAS